MSPSSSRARFRCARTGPFIALVPIVVASICPHASASGIEAEVGLSYGQDSNPLELRGGGPSGVFTELEFSIHASPSRGSRLSLLADATGSRRWYESAAADAGFGWSVIRAGIAAVPWRRGASRFAILAGGSFESYRATLIDPDTGEVYEQISGAAKTVPVPDRLDHDGTGLFMDLRFQTGRSLMLYLDTEWLRRRYTRDYDGVPGLASLDDRSLSLEPGVRTRLSSWLLLDVSMRVDHRSYDELPALDEEAAEVPGEARSYDTTRWQAALRAGPVRGWSFLAGHRMTDRSDAYAGYYDSTGGGTLLSLSYSPVDATRMSLIVSSRSSSYPNALVDNNPNGETREGSLIRYTGEFERELGGWTTLFASGGIERSEDRDPAYVYDRRWMRAGLKLEI